MIEILLKRGSGYIELIMDHLVESLEELQITKKKLNRWQRK
jgi:hypothetical protein